MSIKNELISIYLVLILVILTPFLVNRYTFTLDLIPNVNISPILDLIYGKNSSTYGGTLIFGLIRLTISPEIFQKLLIFTSLFFSSYSMYQLSTTLISSESAGFYSGLLYMINPFTYIRLISGQWYILFSYSLIPLSIKVFIDLLEKKEKKIMIKYVLLISALAVEIHIFIIYLIIIGIIFSFWLIKNKDIRISKIIIIVSIIFISLNSYWIVPVITTKSSIIDTIGEKDIESFSPHGNLYEIVSLYGFWKDYLSVKDYFPEISRIIFLVIIFLTIMGIKFFYKDPEIGIYIKAFVVIWIIGFILASGVNGFFGDIIHWLFSNTLFKGFRDSQKFVVMLILTYSFVGGLGISKIKEINL